MALSEQMEKAIDLNINVAIRIVERLKERTHNFSDIPLLANLVALMLMDDSLDKIASEISNR